MTRRAVAAACMAWLSAVCIWADETHPARGVVLEVDAAHHSLVISCEAIPSYMAPMEMPFEVPDSRVLKSLKPGMTVQFSIVEHEKHIFAEDIHKGTSANFESEPMQAGDLTLLHAAMSPSAAAKRLEIGERVPDFALTDQAQNQIHLSRFQGKVVALTFGYSRCPNPNYCFRLSNNLARVEKRFHDRAGRDLVLLTIMIDPEHDNGPVLASYANTWKADPAVWHFLTGSLPQIKQVAEMFGMNFWRDEGSLTHSLHTIVIDRNGQLAANIEGNQFSAEQLGDLVQTVMNRTN